jgi:hypothetical protein
VIQRFKVLSINENGSETVEFSSHDGNPDENGFYMNDGYKYTRIEGLVGHNYTRVKFYRERVNREEEASEQRARRIKEKYPGVKIKNERRFWDDKVYELISQIMQDNPTLPVEEFKRRANVVQAEDIEDIITPSQRKEAIDYCIQQFYQPAVRFADLNRPSEMRAKAPVPDKWRDTYYNPETRERAVLRQMYNEGYEHMQDRGKSKSPFLSVAREESGLISSTDFAVGSIVFGTPDREYRAPHVTNMLIPSVMLLNPEGSMERHIEETRGISEPLLLQKRETESLFVGEDLSPYVIHRRKNQYKEKERKKFTDEM